ncbi:hypothetical protein [Nonomuraea aurantiaca]|uniref:hypothetical protein n=1 Tax=Nonomuraea aurantiaca TaxID=2878562 RepID=UPI001CD9ADCA|nr:hypothetical protein [Nonomuraea aurantiaca]MCA2230185.1 hypothetical protein [Nonomuraea aurantiaca]
MSDHEDAGAFPAPERPEAGREHARPGERPSAAAEENRPSAEPPPGAGTPGGAGPHALPRPATDPAPHGRCRYDDKPLPPSRGTKKRTYCDERCKNAYYRERERLEREALTTAVAGTDAVLTEARPLADALQALAEQFSGGVQRIETGALQRIATLTAETAEAKADALDARERAETAEQTRRTAERAERDARAAQQQAEAREDRARADAERVQRETGERVVAAERRRATAETNLAHAEEVRDRQADQIRSLREHLAQAAARIDELTAILDTRKEELTHAHGENSRLTDRADQAEQRLTTTTERLQEAGTAAAEARAETRTVRAELAAERDRFEEERERLRAQAEQARQDQAEANTAATRAMATVETRLQVAHEDLQQVRGQLAAAQAATGLALPPLIDVDGEAGVLLADGGAIESVTRTPDGVIWLHLRGFGTPIPLADPGRSPAQAQDLGAALLATAAYAPTQVSAYG